MAHTAAHLVDRVLPHVGIRQWVLTLPYPLRYRCAYDARLTSDVLRAFVRALFASLRSRARRAAPAGDAPPTQCGAVTFVQRFGSALNLNLHFHTLALDGAYRYEPRPTPQRAMLQTIGREAFGWSARPGSNRRPSAWEASVAARRRGR